MSGFLLRRLLLLWSCEREVIERDPRARRLALVRWLADEQRYELLFQARAMVGAKRLVARRAVDHPGSHVVSLFCNRDEVAAAVAALRPPRERAAVVWRQPRLL